MVRIKLACKTGTAEVGGDQKPDAWITVFAPFNKPEIAVTVLVENGGEGSSVAGPIAKKILQDYFEKK
jgi:penicillin-binding protein 2